MTPESDTGSEVFEIDVDRSGERVVIALSGELDVSGASLLQEEFLQAVQSDAGEIVCDVRRMSYMDSTGISVLMAAQKKLKATGRDLVLDHPTERVFKLLEITGVASYFEIRRG